MGNCASVGATVASVPSAKHVEGEIDCYSANGAVHHLWQYSSIADEMKQVRQIDRVTVVLPQGGTTGTHWALTTGAPNCDASVEPHPFYPQKVVSITNFRNINEAVRVEFSTTDPAVPPQSRSGTISLFIIAHDAFHYNFLLGSIDGKVKAVRHFDRVVVTLPPAGPLPESHTIASPSVPNAWLVDTTHEQKQRLQWKIDSAAHCTAVLEPHFLLPQQMVLIVSGFENVNRNQVEKKAGAL